MEKVKQEIEIGGRVLSLQYKRFAQQANSAVVARYGDTMVLVTVVASADDSPLDYFPLTVDYMEKLYAGGRIKGSRWVKREGRPTDEEILTARLIDRSIRPLFPKAYKKEVQVIATVLSVDLENDPKVLAMVAASAALATSTIPWMGPVGSLKVGMKDGTYFANPVDSEMKFSEVDLVVTADKNAIFMIEAAASEVPEEKILGALEFGQKEAAKIIEGISALVKKVKVQKEVFAEPDDGKVVNLIDKKYGRDIDEFAKANSTKEYAQGDELKQAIIAEFGEEKASLVSGAFDKVMRARIRKMILSGTRLDGRKHDQIRPIACEVGVLPRTHGSAFFKRGQTHVLTTTTLGSPSLEQSIETAEGEETKRYLHFYSMPPYATGETGRVGAPNRREIGHGALAERALIPVIPQEEEFPYTIQVVSEVMSSNGSTSMASTCGSTLSLMDAGVPIKSPVSGIAMGLVIEKDKAAILSDIMGIEDGSGDMDFKVAGTKSGVTAIQLDVKTNALTIEILSRALSQAREGRLYIMEKMLEVIPEPRKAISQHAPKIVVVRIPKEKIGEVIGSGGSTIRKIMAETQATIDVEDDGAVTITGLTQEGVTRAREWVEALVKEVVPGEIYEGEVKRIQPFGAFVQILPGKDGLVHVSDMAEGFVKDPEEVVKIGDKVKVRVKEIDDRGRINLSMRLDPGKDRPREERGQRAYGPSVRGGRSYSPRYRSGEAGSPRFAGGDTRRRVRHEERGERRGGPHFPTSRFMPKKKF